MVFESIKKQIESLSKGDPIWVLKFLVLSAVKNKFQYPLTIATLLYGTMHLFALFHYINKKDFRAIQYYSPVLSNSIFLHLTVIPTLLQVKQFESGCDYIRNKFWKISGAFPAAQREIDELMRETKVAYTSCIILALGAATLYTPLKDVSNSLYIFVTLAYKLDAPTTLKDCLTAWSCVYFYMTAYYMTFYIVIIMYYVVHFRCQVILLKWRMINILSRYDIEDETLVADAVCQRDVFMTFRECVRHHVCLTRFHNFFSNYIRIAVGLQIVTCVALLTSCLYIIVMSHGKDVPTAILTEVAAVIVGAICYSYFGVKYQSTMDELLDAAFKCPWRIFNKSNKKVFLIFVSNIKTVSLTGFGLLELNFSLLIWIFHKTVNMVSAFMVLEANSKLKM